jgi:hypothetical protein
MAGGAGAAAPPKAPSAAPKGPTAAQVQEVAAFARRTLAFVEQSAPRPAFEADLKALEGRAQAADLLDDAGRQALQDEIRAVRRRIIFSHPALAFDRLLINKRTSRIPGHMCDQYLGRHSTPGPGLAILDSWKENPRETLLLEGKLPPGMVMNPDLSFDGRRVLFAFCDHSVSENRDLRAYFIYELALDTGRVRQVTGTPSDPRVGAKDRQTVLIEDFDPCYLPDGGFAFISTRSQQFGRCHGSRYVPSYTLYRGELDGSGIRPLSCNEANEWDPSVLADGSLVYTRWDYVNRHDTNFQSLWLMRPDGKGTAHYYGNYSVGPCMIAEARAIPGSRKTVATATDHHGYTAGSIIVIDPDIGQDEGAPLACVTPELPFPERAPPPGTTMLAAPPPGYAPRGRRAATPLPLTEDLFLAAYEHEGQYAIFLLDTLGGRELIWRDPNVSCFAPIPLRPTPMPAATPSVVASASASRTGRFHVQNVYDSTQPIERGTIKALRVNEIISQPTRSKPILSHVNNEIIKRILGTVPVNEDGSVAFEAPAGVPLQLQVLDANGMAVMTMRSLVYLQPGEQASCAGCHESRYQPPLAAPSGVGGPVRRLQPPAGPAYEGGFSFMRTVQPVLDRYCIGCHGLAPQRETARAAKVMNAKPRDGLGELIEAAARGDDPARAPVPAKAAAKPAPPALPSVNLLGSFGQSDRGGQKARGRFTVSYESLMRRGGIKIAQRNQETNYSRPKDYFAHASALAPMLLDGHKDPDGKPRVRLDRQSLQRILDWLDLNAQFYGDYSFNRAESRATSEEGEQALRAAIAKRFGPDLAGQPLAALVNVTFPEESRILKAPLPEKAGGWGQIQEGAFAGTDDPAYRDMRRLVEAMIVPLTRHDIAGTCGSGPEGGCNCGCCWVRLAREGPPKDAPPVTAADRPRPPGAE